MKHEFRRKTSPSIEAINITAIEQFTSYIYRIHNKSNIKRDPSKSNTGEKIWVG